MDLREAVIQIEKDYTLRQTGDRIYSFVFHDDFLTPYDLYWFAIIEEKGKLILTDFADTAQVFPNLTEEELTEICVRNHVKCNNWHIEVEYKNNDDVANYIKVLDELSEKYGNF